MRETRPEEGHEPSARRETSAGGVGVYGDTGVVPGSSVRLTEAVVEATARDVEDGGDTVTTVVAWPAELALDLRWCSALRFRVPAVRAHVTDFAFCTARVPPTPPPTAAAITTTSSIKQSQKVWRGRPRMPDFLGGAGTNSGCTCCGSNMD